MFECVIELLVSTKTVDENSEEGYRTQEVAKYKFDPGFQVGDKFFITNWKIGNWQDESFNFLSVVTKRIYQVIPHPQPEEDVLRLSIVIEAAEKENVARVAEIMKKLNPGAFKD